MTSASIKQRQEEYLQQLLKPKPANRIITFCVSWHHSDQWRVLKAVSDTFHGSQAQKIISNYYRGKRMYSYTEIEDVLWNLEHRELIECVGFDPHCDQINMDKAWVGAKQEADLRGRMKGMKVANNWRVTKKGVIVKNLIHKLYESNSTRRSA